MADVLYESYQVGTTHDQIGGTYWLATKFTASSNHDVSKISLNLSLPTGSPGTMTVSVQGVDGSNHPDMTNTICSGTFDTSTAVNGWNDVTMGTPGNVLNGVVYAIVVRCPSGDLISNYIYWHVNTALTPNGKKELSADSGATWTAYITSTHQYKVWGAATAPTVTTQATTSISQTTATGNGNITNLGNPTATQHGHCWSTSANPTTADSKTENGVPGATGAFTSAITGLTPGTLYHTRAYATNTAGTSYGEDVEFRALGSEVKYRVTIKGTCIHYIDDNGAERYREGTLV